MKIVSSALCETGNVRKINQDAIYSCCSENWGFFALADGMGGHENGEEASQETIRRLRHWMEGFPRLEEMETPDIVRQLSRVLTEANDAVREGTSPGMLCGCTVVVLVLVRRECILISAGDSRCYEVQEVSGKKILEKLTTDDIVGGNGSQREWLTNALGIKSPFLCRRRVLPFEGTHIYLLCTDGIYKYCPAPRMLSVLQETDEASVESRLAALQEIVEYGGAGDNYSAFLIWAKS